MLILEILPFFLFAGLSLFFLKKTPISVRYIVVLVGLVASILSTPFSHDPLYPPNIILQYLKYIVWGISAGGLASLFFRTQNVNGVIIPHNNRLLGSLLWTIGLGVLSCVILGLPFFVLYFPGFFIITDVLKLYKPGPEGMIVGIEATIAHSVIFLIVEAVRSRKGVSTRTMLEERMISFFIALLIGNILLVVVTVLWEPYIALMQSFRR